MTFPSISRCIANIAAVSVHVIYHRLLCLLYNNNNNNNILYRVSLIHSSACCCELCRCCWQLIEACIQRCNNECQLSMPLLQIWCLMLTGMCCCLDWPLCMCACFCLDWPLSLFYMIDWLMLWHLWLGVTKAICCVKICSKPFKGQPANPGSQVNLVNGCWNGCVCCACYKW